MTTGLDIATVLQLQKSSYLVGALAFLYLRFSMPRPHAGLFTLSAAVLCMVVGSTLAGEGVQGNVPLSVWTFGSFSLGMIGYSLIFIGFRALNRQAHHKKDLWVFLPALGLVVSAFLSGFHLNQPIRSAIFNFAATASLLACSIDFLKQTGEPRRRDKYILSVLCAAGALLSAIAGIGFLKPYVALFHPVTAFFCIIIVNFSIFIFAVILIAEQAFISLKLRAETDELTGTFNRRYLFENHPHDVGPNDAVLLMDLDHFKRVNDTHGHLVGDEILRCAAGRIQDVLRKADILVRYGGEEFIALIRDVDHSKARDIAERIRHAIADQAFEINNQPIFITVSIGIAYAPADDGKIDIQSLICRADEGLYTAKNNGRNCVQADFALAAA